MRRENLWWLGALLLAATLACMALGWGKDLVVGLLLILWGIWISYMLFRRPGGPSGSDPVDLDRGGDRG